MTDRENLAREVAERLGICAGWPNWMKRYPGDDITKIYDALLDSEEKCRKLEEALKWYALRDWSILLDDQVFAHMLKDGHSMSDKAKAALSGKG